MCARSVQIHQVLSKIIRVVVVMAWRQMDVHADRWRT